MSHQLQLDLAAATSSNGHKPTAAEMFAEDHGPAGRYTDTDLDALMEGMAGWRRDHRPADATRGMACRCLDQRGASRPLVLDPGPECGKCGRAPA